MSFPNRLILNTIAAFLIVSGSLINAGDTSTSVTSDGVCAEFLSPTHDESSDGFKYRCELIHQLEARGLSLSSPIGGQIHSELLRPFETVLRLQGETPLPKPALQYLFEEFPDTAQLVNFYKKTNYHVVYTNPQRSQFFATNNRNMRAMVDIIDKRETIPASSYLLFEDGNAKLLFWRFDGKSIIEINLYEFGEDTQYDIKIHVFTSSRAFHFFFKSALFKYLIKSMFNRILGDMVDATKQLIDSNDDFPTNNPNFVEDLLDRFK
ncbi:MAG: hypothetical protein QNI91_06270 [Arenicellales bacterium]|nr:hypothetical protein [Arenicellales bacterium]